MQADDRRAGTAVARTIAVIVLVTFATVALRGHLPGAEPDTAEPDTAEPDTPTGGPGTLIAVAAMLAVSMAVIAIAMVTQTRRPAATPVEPGARPDGRGAGGRPPWRLLMIAAAALLAWLLLVLLLMRWSAQLGIGAEVADVPPDAAPPDVDRAVPEPNSEPPGDQDPPGGGVFGFLAVVTVVLIVASIVATVVGRRRVAPAPPPLPGAAAPTPRPPSGPDLVRAAELGLAEIADRSRDPREAIIACYAAMESELAKSPGTIPQASDTPTEVLARAVRTHALRADSATGLVDLFEEARFSPHVMDEGHRTDALRALRLVLDELEAAR